MKITILLVLPGPTRTSEPAVFQRVSHIPDKPPFEQRRDDPLSLVTGLTRPPFRSDR